MTAGDDARRFALRRPLPAAPTTRFAPAPTGLLHLGHVANALATWGLARAAGGSVLLRIEDHDRQRSRPAFEADLLDDLAWLGFVPDRPSSAELRSGRPSAFRQSDNDALYAASLARLAAAVEVYRCTCSRATFDRWAAEHGRPWTGPGCPGECRGRRITDAEPASLRAALGGGEEAWDDLLLGPSAGPVAEAGDVVVRDRLGNWTYPFAVVVDDLRQRVDLVVRGRDLVADTPRQIRLARLLGRETAPRFAHHPLVLRPDGSKLSKSTGDTGVRELRAAGWAPEAAVGAAAAAIGLVAEGSAVDATEAGRLIVESATMART
ncbi:MAG TPA: glutamate--tRNA ligase family protein [Candidatus Limnocylindrales bacterium]|nr:glutamate--tRNA ligase family protein [Candidatus Limnocylindrales bacterium]